MIRREDYKAIKRMSREQMSAYLQRIYRRGYDAGRKSVATNISKNNPGPVSAEEGEQHE